MKEHYDSDEYKQFDEYKYLKAEQYYTRSENYQLQNEYFNKQQELSTDSQSNANKTSGDVAQDRREAEQENFDQIQKSQNQQVTQTDASTGASSSSSAASSSAANTSAQVITESATTSIVGTVTATVAGAAGIAAICVNVLTANATMQVIKLEAGSDYVNFIVDVADLDENVEYKLRIYNEYVDYKIDVNEAGEISELVTGLKSFSSYELSLISIDTEFGIHKYSTAEFYTLKADSPTAGINYNVTVNPETNDINVEYSTYISDINDNGTDYYVEALLGGEVLHYNSKVEKSYISGLFTVPNNSTIVMNAYATVYDRLEIVGSATIEVSIEGDWTDPVYTWNDTDKTFTASRQNKTFTDLVEKEVVKATTDITEATCESPGKIIYTAQFNNKVFKTQTKEVILDPLGHDFVFDSFIFSDDGKSAQAKYVCSHDNSHVVMYDAEVTSSVKVAATCEESGTTTYIATYDGHTDSVDIVDIPALGHNYQFDSFVWNEDNKTAVAKYVCEHDSEHVETHEATMTTEIITPAGYETEGLTRYVATYDDHTEYKDVTTEPLGEGFVFDSFLFGEDGKTAQIRYVRGNEEKFFDAEVTSEKISDPTCEEYGVTRYTATYDTHSDYVELHDIESLGHDYVFDSIIFLEDGTKAQAKYVCSRDPEHEIYYDAVVTSEVKTPATCESGGTTTYTATYDGHTATKDVDDIEPLGHDYQFDSFVWSEDGKTAQAKYVCSHDSEHVELYDAEVTSEVKTPATCEGVGTTTYTATYDDHTDTKDVDDIEPLGHDYQFDSFVWSEDGKTAQAKYVCSHDSEHVELYDAEVTSEVKVEATCEEGGTTTYTATYDGHTDTKDVDDIEPIGHNYGDATYEWDEDNSHVTATVICLNDDEHVVTETVETTYEVITAATSTTAGTGKYTATFENPLFETQEKEITIPIDYDLDTYVIDKVYIKDVDTGKVSIKLELSEYTEDITFSVKLKQPNGDVLDAGLFDSSTFEFSVVDLLDKSYNASDLSLELTKNYLQTEKVDNYSVSDLIGLSFEFGDLTYDSSKSKYYVPISSSFTTGTITDITASFVSGNNVSEGEISDGKIMMMSPPGETFIAQATVYLETEYGTTSIVFRSSQFEAQYGVELEEISYLTDYSSKSIVVKPKVMAPDGYVVKLKINDSTELSSISGNQTPDGYLTFNASSIDSGTVEYYLSNGTDTLPGGTFNLDFTLSLSLEGSSANCNPYDCAVTYNDDGTINLYVPLDATFTADDEFVRVLIYNSTGFSRYYDVKSGSLACLNLPNNNYSLDYYQFKVIDGINYKAGGAMPSGSTEVTLGTYNTGEFINITYVSSNLENVVVYYDDGTSASVTSTYNESENSAEIYYDTTKTPIRVTFTYTRSDTIDRCYQNDEWFTEHGLEKVGGYTQDYDLTVY